jgi:hypothetical protein
MPKNKKGTGKQGAVATAETDDDFEAMLAEIRSADLFVTTATSSSTSSTRTISSDIPAAASGSSSSSEAKPTPASRFQTAVAEASDVKVSEVELVQACIRGDMAQLQRWSRRGIRVLNGVPLVRAAEYGKLDVMRFLVSDLGADVNQADDDDWTPLLSAAQEGQLAAAECLLKEFGADVNLPNEMGATPLLIAAQHGHLAVVRSMPSL